MVNSGPDGHLKVHQIKVHEMKVDHYVRHLKTKRIRIEGRHGAQDTGQGNKGWLSSENKMRIADGANKSRS